MYVWVLGEPLGGNKHHLNIQAFQGGSIRATLTIFFKNSLNRLKPFHMLNSTKNLQENDKNSINAAQSEEVSLFIISAYPI